ncbi:MAG TPA: type II secretion system protein [Thermoguttaceae bacterium]|nr:type II secretion system protein [Thermoguttaceae bacterium]
MKKKLRRNAFTLIEVLIVVVIMAVLAATIIPQFTTSTKDARDNAAAFNVRTMQCQVELYKQQHLEKYPPANDFVNQMTTATNIDSGTTGETPYGPYMQEVPANPYNGSQEVVAVAAEGTAPDAPVGTAGWQYDQSNGRVYANHAEAFAGG